ncbi:3'-5'-exodeoxyribonuclease [Maudiozyma humilis]|uniref:3'-5'-exodeoxyribonuclease n=1 Tax=Maudiozyma humilis TaxID=51915 RepID=A0AAV5RZD6_MAUHU|nr:3'-5'-exodeoxyribonuclease [Kazachstania humilis]
MSKQIPRYLPPPDPQPYSPRYYDIGMNLTDTMFRGIYHGKQYHAPDIPEVLKRARDRHVRTLLLTGSSIEESRQLISMVAGLKNASPVKLYYTVGVHPCCVNEFAEASGEDPLPATTGTDSTEKVESSSTAVETDQQDKDSKQPQDNSAGSKDSMEKEVDETARAVSNASVNDEAAETASAESGKTIWDVITANPVTASTEATAAAELAKSHPDTNEYSMGLYKSLISSDETVRNASISIVKQRVKELYALLQSRLDDPDFRAIGEFGLDYERLHYSCRELQLIFFAEQLKLVCLLKANKPLFLHMRKAGPDFTEILRRFIEGFTDERDTHGLRELTNTDKPIHYKFAPDQKFVVHSYSDSLEDLDNLLGLSPHCYIGLNGASFRTDENIEAVRRLPLDRMLLETDAPWCEIRPTHVAQQFLKNWKPQPIANPYKTVKKNKLAKMPREEWVQCMVKSRNEPCMMEQVAFVVAEVKKCPIEEIVEIAWKNSCKVFGK